MKRFTYGVYLEQPLEVADAADLAAGETFQQLPGERRLLREQSQSETQRRAYVWVEGAKMQASLTCKPNNSNKKPAATCCIVTF